MMNKQHTMNNWFDRLAAFVLLGVLTPEIEHLEIIQCLLNGSCVMLLVFLLCTKQQTRHSNGMLLYLKHLQRRKTMYSAYFQDNLKLGGKLLPM
jgi:hypothetical protein